MLIIVIDPNVFVPLEHFKKEVDGLISRIKANPRELCVEEILIPGERAYRQRETRLKSGIHLDDNLINQLT